MNQDSTNVLLTIVGYASRTVKEERLAHVSAEEWQAVVKLARQYGVDQLVYHRLKQLGIALQGELADELKHAYQVKVVQNMRLYQELGKLLRRLHEKEIMVIALKGAHLAELVYDNIGLRSMKDIDLLVRKDDMLRAEQELLALGYIPDDVNRIITEYNIDFSYMLPEKYIHLDLHWLLVDPLYRIRFDIEPLWNRAQPVILAQAPALVLSPADLLLFLCFHTAKHTYGMQVKMLYDIGEVVQRYEAKLDWLEIAARARQWGIVHSAYLILRLAQELLEVPIPRDWLASLQPAGFNESYLLLARQQVLDTHMEGVMLRQTEVFRLLGLKGLGEKIALLHDHLVPSREKMAFMYHVPLNSWRIYLYYPVHIKDLLIRYGATLWRWAYGDPQTQAALATTNKVTELLDWLMSK